METLLDSEVESNVCGISPSSFVLSFSSSLVLSRDCFSVVIGIAYLTLSTDGESGGIIIGRAVGKIDEQLQLQELL